MRSKRGRIAVVSQASASNSHVIRALPGRKWNKASVKYMYVHVLHVYMCTYVDLYMYMDYTCSVHVVNTHLEY